ncbi:MAG: MFS transporter [Vicinamibacteria bacterium]
MDTASSSSGQNDRREVFGWVLYAWAVHGFSTTVASVFLAPYVTELAQAAVGENGPVFAVPMLSAVTAKSFFPFCASLSVVLQVVLLPLLGAIADYTSLKKPLLTLFAALGACATCLLFFVGGGLDFRWGGGLFVVANLSLGAGTVLYNAFLPGIASDDQRDRVSSRGFAAGYLGGGLLLAANLVFIQHAGRLGVSSSLALRLSLLSAGLWWVGFLPPSLRRLRSRRPPRPRPPERSLLGLGLSELAATLRQLRGRPHTRRYLIAYLLYNDGIQTVIAMASVFLAQELFFAHGQPTDRSFLAGNFLMVQLVAFLGALLFAALAARTRAKSALALSLVIWSAVILYGYAFLRTKADAVWMSALIALVLGGSQALSRSLFSRMIPAGREASFFALYEISSSGTSWIGPLIFGAVVAVTDSYREALLSLIVLFVAGTVLLIGTDVDAAFAEAREISAPGARTRRRPAASWFRRRLADGVAGFARLAVHVFFRETVWSGLEGIPRAAPVVLVANHNNSVVDSFLLMALPAVRPRMLAKSTIFSHPVMGPLLLLAGALRVYRRRDPGADVARNSDTFSRCHGLLADGGSIALFPEGTSHSEGRQLPLKSGAARIVLGAEARLGPLGVRILPVGIHYDAKDRFRSRVAIHVGPPLDPGPEVALYAERPRDAIRNLTARIARSLEEARAQARRAPDQEALPAPGGAGRVLAGVLTVPILVVGYILNWLPYRLPGWVSGWLSRSPDDPATYKLLGGVLVFPIAWVAEAALAARFAGLAWGIAVAVSAPATGYLALRLRERPNASANGAGPRTRVSS